MPRLPLLKHPILHYKNKWLHHKCKYAKVPEGTVIGEIDGVRFPFDFALGKMVKSMYFGCYDFEIRRIIKKYLKPGGVFIDVGANVGYLSAVGAGLVGKTGQVHSFEPVPRYFDYVQRTAKFIYSLGPKNHVEYEVDNIHTNLPTTNVNVITLDDLLKSRKEVNKIDFIKVDVEGYEYDFLLGARETIEAFRPMVLMEIEEHRLVKFNTTAEQIFNFMYQLGYRYLSVTENAISEGDDYQKDLKKGRDFIFYTSKNTPIY